VTPAFIAGLCLAAIASAALAGVYLLWPRRLTAEEWVFHRRALSAMKPPVAAVGTIRLPRPRWLRPPSEAYGTLAAPVRPDLALLGLFGRTTFKDERALLSSLFRRALIGGAAGFAAGLLIWIGQGHPLPPWMPFGVSLAGLVLLPTLTWIRIRREAGRLRSAIENRLPRLLTAARMLLESGAATPERALSEAVAIHDDPASEVLREALRSKEVLKLEIEEAIDEVAGRYAIAALVRIADGFRVGRRYGTGMAQLLAEHARELGSHQHQRYRERITRAPVLMTVPALLFFVAPLLVLIMYLVFSPLLSALGQL